MTMTTVKVHDFFFDTESVHFDPALEFDCVEHDDSCEIYGNDLYGSVYVHACDKEKAVIELHEDVMPFLWRQYAIEDDMFLSLNAKKLKNDLLSKVKFFG